MDHVTTLFEHFVALVGHLAWPATVVLAMALLLQESVRDKVLKLLSSITNLKVGPGGVEITRQVNEISTLLESLDVKHEQLRVHVFQEVNRQLARAGGAEPGAPPSADVSEAGEDGIPAGVWDLAKEYERVNIPDWGRRVSKKDDLANQLGNYINTHRVSRDALAEQKHKGLIIGLASAIHSAPEVGDAERLLKVAPGAKWLHVKYRVVLAMTSLAQRRLLSIEQAGNAMDILELYLHDEVRPADNPLKRRIGATRSILQDYIREERGRSQCTPATV